MVLLVGIQWNCVAIAAHQGGLSVVLVGMPWKAAASPCPTFDPPFLLLTNYKHHKG